MNITNYELERGDTFAERLVFTSTDDDGVVTPIDITGWTIFFTLKLNKEDADAYAVISKTITDIPSPTLGIYTFVVDAAELNTFVGIYYYDFQIKLADGKVYTLTQGTMTFNVDITRRVTA